MCLPTQDPAPPRFRVVSVGSRHYEGLYRLTKDVSLVPTGGRLRKRGLPHLRERAQRGFFILSFLLARCSGHGECMSTTVLVFLRAPGDLFASQPSCAAPRACLPAGPGCGFSGFCGCGPGCGCCFVVVGGCVLLACLPPLLVVVVVVVVVSRLLPVAFVFGFFCGSLFTALV